MDEKQIKALTDAINAELTRVSGLYDAMQKEITGKADEDKLSDLSEKAKKSEDNIKTLSDQLDQIEIKLKDFSLNKGPESPFVEMHKAYKEGKDKMKAPGGSFNFELKGSPEMYIKQVGDIYKDPNLSDAALATSVIIPDRISGVEKAPDRTIKFLDVVSRGVTGSNRVTWVERSARTEGAAVVANDHTKFPQSDFTWIQKVANVEKIATYVKATNEALEDWDELLTQIRLELFPMLERELEEELYSGNGASPHLVGLIQNARPYEATGLDARVKYPNTFDAIRAAAYQCAANNYDANYAFLNPADFAEMEMSKNANGTYVIPPFAAANGLTISGLRVVQSNLVAAGNVLVGDFARAALYMRRNIEIKIWDQNEDDPLYDMKTITGSLRAAVKIPAPHYYSFVYDELDDIKTAITEITG